jgi:alpha-L-fucosidase
MGPKRDVIGLWREAARKQGLRFGVTEHLAASWNWYGVTKLCDQKGPMAGVAYDGVNPEFFDLYHSGNEKSKVDWWYRNAPDAWKQEWFNRIKDLVDSYQPDLLYSDGSLPFGEYGRKLLAHFYNSNIQQHGGKLEAVYNCKFNDDGGEYTEGMCVQDLERGVQQGIKAEAWQTDTCVGDWYYKRDIRYKTPATVIRMLVDIVSKNGNLLLNFPVRGDGTLDAQEESILASLAEWISVNGEAIYGTRPWKVYGEGAGSVSSGNFNEDKLHYTAEDIRFTTKEGNLYAIALGWPETSKLTVRSLAGASAHSVRLLGDSELLKWSRDPQGLVVQLPRQQRGQHAFALRIEGGV